LTFVNAGETVTVLGQTANGNWLLVRDQAGNEGYVAANRFELNGVPPVITPSAVTPTPNGQATALDAATMFCAPDTTSAKIVDVRINEVVDVLGRWSNQSWLYIKDAQGRKGFVASSRFDYPFDSISGLPVVEPDPECGE
jgi:hypothetical protein